MKKWDKTISKKLARLYKTGLDTTRQENQLDILGHFTEAGIDILGADYGYALYKSFGEKEYNPVYKSLETPNKLSTASPKQKCINIPIVYGEYIHGSIVLCYKNKPVLDEEYLALSKIIGILAAKSITIPWLIENERRALSLAEKQKEMEVLWTQEKLKTEFTENAAHELRTPLAIMKGNVDLALMEKNNARLAQEALSAVNDEIRTLSEILENLMLITAARRDAKNTFSLQPTDIVRLVRVTAGRMQAVAREKGISIELQGLDTARFVSGDKIYLEKLFLNLIKNAVIYGREGGYIKVKIGEEKGFIKIEVKDNGTGISKEDLPRIFERFYRGDKAHTAVGVHSGLGLPIAKWAAETHRGKIDVKSTYGKGSTFTVNLPLIKSPASK